MVTNQTKIKAPWKPRRAGLSRNENVSPLLQTLNGRPIFPASQESTDQRLLDDISTPGPNSARTSMSLPNHLSSPSPSPDAQAPHRDPGVIPSSPGSFELPDPIPQKPAPKSSQDSTRTKTSTRDATESVDSSDSHDEVAQRAQIRTTTFRSSKNAEPTAVSISIDSKTVSGSPRRRAIAHKSGSGLTAAPKKQDDVDDDIFRKRRDPTRVYGAKGVGARAREKKASKRESTLTSDRNAKRQRSSQEKEVKNESTFPEDEKTSIRQGFLPEALPPLRNNSSPARPKSYIPPPVDSSPPRTRAGFPERLAALDETPGFATQIAPFMIPDPLGDPSMTDEWTITPTASLSKGKTQSNDKNALGQSQSPIMLTSSPVIPLLELPSSPIHLPALLKPALCPLCKDEVDRDLLTEYEDAHAEQPPTVQSMQRFCIKHKKRSAREVWEEKGYPDIEWCNLNGRIADLYPFIRSILQGKRKSYFAGQFRDKIKGGQNKTLLSSDENLTPGYYGIRGLRQMSENLIQEFSSVLRKRALEDSLVSARGHTAYLQGVLVPELATRLVMEDMVVGEEEARKILKESSWVGELVNDEIADVVFESDSEDDE